MSASRQVVITGVGVVSPIGIGKLAFAESLRLQRGGIRVVENFRNTSMPAWLGGEVLDFDGKRYVTPRKSIKIMSREVQLAFAAASLAVEDAGLNTADLDHDRFGVMYGSEMLYSVPEELIDAFRCCIVDGKFIHDRWGERGMSNLFPLWMLKYLPNMPACQVAISHDARGPNNTITLDEVSSLLALAEAVRCIERGHTDVMIAGGTGSKLNLTGLVFSGYDELSRHNNDPGRALRPFDAKRDGMVNGEGAGAFVVETADHAAARGATVLARILGFGNAFEARRKGAVPTGGAVRRSIQQALREARLSAADLGHVNANGDGSIDGDAMEAAAIRDELGDIPVTAPKSYFGNLGAGTGAVEMLASVLAFQHGEIPVTLNYEHPDPRCPIQVVHGHPAPLGKPTAILLNQTVTGQAAAAILAAP